MAGEEKTPCRTPASGRDGVTNIPTWKFECLREAILDAAREPILFKDLSAAVGNRLSSERRTQLGSLGWHVTTVKLELEMRGEIERLPGSGPQKIRAASR